MKQIQIALLISLCTVASCSESSIKDQVTGQWTLTSFSNESEMVELTDCDTQTTWNFSSESAEPLGDATEVQKLEATAPGNCQYYGFDAKWMVKDGKLFITSSRIGGMGGNSLAGLMEVKELTPNKMVLTMMNKELTFER